MRIFLFFSLILTNCGMVWAKQSSEKEHSKSNSQKSSQNHLIDLHYPDETEVRVIAEKVALALGKNLIIDTKISGKIIIYAPHPLEPEDAFNVFLSALSVVGVAAVRTGPMLKLIPISSAKKSNVPVFKGQLLPDTDEVITRVVSLKYISPAKALNLLSRFTDSNTIVPLERTNSLIVTDYSASVGKVIDILSILDVADRLVHLHHVSLKNVDPKKMISLIEGLLTERGSRTNPLRISRDRYRFFLDDLSTGFFCVGNG